MAIDRFFIAPYDKESGLNTSVKPWLIPDSAFSTLNNAYVYRGRVRKRFGSFWLGNSQLLTRLRVSIGNTDGGGNFNGFVPLSAVVPIVTPAIGQMFSVEGSIFTVVALGNPANLLRNDGRVGVATFDTTTGQVIINNTGFVASLVYYYPALPVVGMISYETATLEDEPTIAFDTKFSYLYTSGTGWDRITAEATPGASVWSGNDSQYFWGTSWVGVNAFDFDLFVTNFNENEANFMRVYDGASWDNFAPIIQAPPQSPTQTRLVSARILVTFHNHLVALNTWENENGTLRHYQFRARWSNFQDPRGANAWRQDIPGQGSGADLPINSAIVTAEFIKDRLIVYAENSTWELVWTGNPQEVFQWQQINTELGAESTFSVVPFDRIAIGIGNVGIHACNGANVERIDTSIPQEVFKIHQLSNGIERVFGIRDYFVELVYWSFPSLSQDDTFPFANRILVYNYKTQTWAFNDDSITVFGYFQPQTAITWDDLTVSWDSDIQWDSGSGQARFRQVIAGNQQGWTFIIDPDTPTNAPALQITNIVVVNNTLTITSINHNFRGGEFIYIQGIVDTGNIALVNNLIFQVQTDLLDANNFSVIYSQTSAFLAGTYLGGGTIARVSQIDIRTKEYNFYQNQGKDAAINKIDFMVDATDVQALCSLAVNYYCSTSQNNLLLDSSETDALLGLGNIDTFPYDLYPYEANASRLWRSLYISSVGEVIQLQITMTNDQMMEVIPVQNPDNTFSFTGPTFVDFQLHAMCLYAQPTSRLQ